MNGSNFSTNVITHSGILEIQEVSGNDEGFYACNVITNTNRHIKKTIHIKKPTFFLSNDQEMPHLKIIPIKTDIREGGSVELECHTDKQSNLKSLNVTRFN